MSFEVKEKNGELPKWQKKILDERLKSIDDGTAKFYTLDEMNLKMKALLIKLKNKKKQSV